MLWSLLFKHQPPPTAVIVAVIFGHTQHAMTLLLLLVSMPARHQNHIRFTLSGSHRAGRTPPASQSPPPSTIIAIFNSSLWGRFRWRPTSINLRTKSLLYPAQPSLESYSETGYKGGRHVLFLHFVVIKIFHRRCQQRHLPPS